MKPLYQTHFPFAGQVLLVFAAFVLTSAPLHSAAAPDGYFIALKSCQAFHSKNKQTNPGGVKTTAMMAYVVKDINKPNGD